MKSRASKLDAEFFAEGPARDERFDVKELWCECNNLPQGHPEKETEFYHRQMNEEVNGIENSARSLSDFPEADWELRVQIARQCSDEARHVLMFREVLEKRGGRVGQSPILNFQYRIITKIDTLVGRLAVQNRSFEASGIDAISSAINDEASSSDMKALFDAQLADEVNHVRFANEWIRILSKREPRNALLATTALSQAGKGFEQVKGDAAGSEVWYLVDKDVRLEAGFLPEEIALVDKRVKEMRREKARAAQTS